MSVAPVIKNRAMRRSFVAVLMLAALVACSDDGGSPGGTSTTPPATVSDPSTTTPTSEPSTSLASTTTSTSTATSTSTTTTSSTSVATTEPPSAPTDAAVAAFVELNEALVRCYAEIPHCDPDQLAPYYSPEALPRTLITSGNERGIVLRNLESRRIFIQGAEAKGVDRVDVSYCGEDGVVQVLPTETGDSVLNDRFSSTEAVAEMRLDPDGRWRAYALTIRNQAVGQENSLCAGL